jgi:Fe-S-cluster containining protein
VIFLSVVETSFPCTGCGACCKTAGFVPEMKEYALENGVCKFLKSDNSCEIYENRPKICNIEEMRKLYNAPKDEYYKLTADICNKLQEHFEVPIKFKVSYEK